MPRWCASVLPTNEVQVTVVRLSHFLYFLKLTTPQPYRNLSMGTFPMPTSSLRNYDTRCGGSSITNIVSIHLPGHITVRHANHSTAARAPNCESDGYLVSSSKPLLSSPNLTCTVSSIQHTMRFTTWSTVTNVFIVSTVALLSLIPAANAFDIVILSPAGGETYRPREKATVSWRIDKYVPKQSGRP